MLPTTYRGQVRDAAVADLVAARTLAGPNVFTARDWPTSAQLLPALLVQVPIEQKVARSKGQRSYITTMHLIVLARVAGGSPGDIEDTLDALCEQVSLAVLLSPALQGMTSTIGTVHTELRVTAEAAAQFGEARVAFELEVPEDYVPTGAPLQSIELGIKAAGSGAPLVSGTVTFPQT